ncbi:hypothetical protein FGO68_gene11030 [Halteria grandinella]|uniref:CHK kinase-like domain-containing protein n=1 Tax=Halteria grandinella TaxID=5974 RepID=A0A8J8NDG5_HALGN|nr:hypothetical protein FGO68_gene11030 [Halteria grandinella]
MIIVENRDEESEEDFKSKEQRLQHLSVEERGKIHFLRGSALLQVSSTKIRELCHTKDYEALKNVIGIEKVSNYIREQHLFTKDDASSEKAIQFKDIGINICPKAAYLLLRSITIEKLQQVFEYAGIQAKQIEIVEEDHLGEHGYQGKFLRIRYQLSEAQQWKTLIVKIAMAPEFSAESQALLHFKLSGHYRSPVIPKIYLSILANEEWTDKYFMILMEDIDWGRTYDSESGLTLKELATVIDDLAEFHNYQLDAKSISASDFTLKAKDHYIKPYMKQALHAFNNRLRHFPKEVAWQPVISWLNANFDKLFAEWSDPQMSPIYVICHGDFTQGNVMVERSPQDECKTRTAFIDWESYFMGNGLVDLAFIVLYGTEIGEFGKRKNIYDEAFEFYCNRLVRHGHYITQNQQKKMKRSFNLASFFALFRYLTGFAGYILNCPEEAKLKQKFRNCMAHCMQAYEEIMATEMDKAV